MDIQGKVALVTGGAIRVGKAITLALAQAGANVVVNYNASAQPAQDTVREAESHGVQGLAIQCDVSAAESVQAMADAVKGRFGGIDILVNAAGHFGKITVPTDDLEMWRRVTRISIDGAFYVSNAFAPTMLARGGGCIVNILDLSAWMPWVGYTAHAVGKAGMLALTNQLALELAPTIRVNAVAPGAVLAPPGYSEAQQQAVANRNLLNRWGSADDVARAVRFLVEADFVNGDVLYVDGGEHIAQHKRAKPS
jgi:NAD(P)-dependent dehydrogenase (short-subunit alcohol dehydrogenase family)